MRKILVAVVAALAITTTTANAREPDTVCYARVYDLAHLAEHPEQLVTAVRLCLQPHDDDGHGRVADFTLDIKRRGDIKALHALGSCRSDGLNRGISCKVECDGGGVYVEVAGFEYVLMYIDEGIRIQECGKEDLDDGNGIEVTAGRDDKVFRLDRVR